MGITGMFSVPETLAGDRSARSIRRRLIVMIGAAAVIVLAVLAALALGSVVSALSRTTKIAGAIGSAVFFPAMFCAGVWLPVQAMPHVLARIVGYTPFGAVLDSACDRAADGALFAALAWWCLGVGQNRLLGVAALVCLVSGQLVSYVKARAEGLGLSADGGLVERAERLILALVGTGLHGLGVPYALDVALWLLAVGSLWTVGQRILSVYRSAQALPPAPPVP